MTTANYQIRIEYGGYIIGYPFNVYVTQQGKGQVAEFHGRQLASLLGLAAVAISEAESGGMTK